MSFRPKSSTAEFGFAAGCEAVALPRRSGAIKFFGLWPSMRPLAYDPRGRARPLLGIDSQNHKSI